MNIHFKTVLFALLFALPSVAQDKETEKNGATSADLIEDKRVQQDKALFAFLDEHFPGATAELEAVRTNEGEAAYEAVYDEQIAIHQHYKRCFGSGGMKMAMLVIEQNKMYQELQVLLDRYEELDADDPARVQARANAEPLLAKSNTFRGEWAKVQVELMKKRKVPHPNQKTMIAAMEKRAKEMDALRANPKKVFDDYIAGREKILADAKKTKKKLPANWHIDPKKAMEAAKKSGKPIHVFCSATWCGPCQVMVKEVFPKEDVQKALEDFEPLYADGDVYGVFCRKYHARIFPTCIIINAEGDFLHRCDAGGMDAEEFIEWLNTTK